MSNPKLNEAFDSFSEDAGNPLRLKIMKRLSFALEQITPDNGFSNDLRTYTDALGDPIHRVYRGHEIVSGPNPELPKPIPVAEEIRRRYYPLPYINIKERAFLDLDEERRPALAGTESHEVLEVLVQGWAYFNSQDRRASYATDEAYILLDDVRRRIAILQLDENHDKRVFRIAQRDNTAVKLIVSDGTIQADENNEPEFFLRLAIQLVEDPLVR